MKLHLGCGKTYMDDWVNIDASKKVQTDLVFNLDKINQRHRLPYDDNSVEAILASHLLEHLQNPMKLMQELYRVAEPGCICNIKVPHGASDSAWTDPMHVRPYFPTTFAYFGQPCYEHYVDYGYTADWEPTVLEIQPQEHFMGLNDQEFLNAVQLSRNSVWEMSCFLRAIKPAREQLLSLNTAPKIIVVRPEPKTPTIVLGGLGNGGSDIQLS